MQKEEDYEEKYEKLRRTLKARISVMAKRIRLKFGMEWVLPRGIFHRKNCAVPCRHYWVTDAGKWHLLGFCYNTHLSITRLYWLCLATWSTIVCLDYTVLYIPHPYGNLWWFVIYTPDLPWQITVTYPVTAPEIAIPELDGKTAKMYR